MASDSFPHHIKTEYGWALATYPLAIFLACGILLCGSWLVFLSCLQLPCGFTRWILSRSSLISLLDETRDHLHRRAPLPLSFCPPRPHIITTHVYTHHPSPGVTRSLAFSVLFVAPYCLISSRLPFLFLVLCFPQSWVIIRVFFWSACVRPSTLFLLPFPFPILNLFREKPPKKEILYKCILYPSTLRFTPFSLLPSFPLFYL